MQGVGDLMTDPQMHTINQQFGLGENNEQYSIRLIWFFGISCIPFGRDCCTVVTTNRATTDRGLFFFYSQVIWGRKDLPNFSTTTFATKCADGWGWSPFPSKNPIGVMCVNEENNGVWRYKNSKPNRP